LSYYQSRDRELQFQPRRYCHKLEHTVLVMKIPTILAARSGGFKIDFLVMSLNSVDHGCVRIYNCKCFTVLLKLFSREIP